jgi:hypothetical protein
LSLGGDRERESGEEREEGKHTHSGGP